MKTHRIGAATAAWLCFGWLVCVLTPGNADAIGTTAATPAAAAVPTATMTPAPPVAGFSTVHYPSTRIGDIAPVWTLPNPAGYFWRSSDQIAQQPILLLTVQDQWSFSGRGDDIKKDVASIGLQAARLRGAACVVLIENSPQIEALFQPYPNVLLLREAAPGVRYLFGSSPRGMVLTAIDKGGFIRQIEPIVKTDLIGPMLQRFGDTTPPLAEGQPAPDFAIPDMNGQVRRLSDLRGHKNLLLTFFPKCFTGGCINHLMSLRDSDPSLAANDVTVWAVSVDPAGGPKGQLAFAQSLSIPFPLIPDTGRNLSALYGAVAGFFSVDKRQSILIDKNGIVRFIDRQVKVRTHGQDVLQKLRELGMGK